MTDQELLEAAAKAAGYELGYVDGNDGIRQRPEWNPLEDDGAALRLAVKLRLSVEHHNDVSQPHPWVRVEDRDGRWTHAGPSLEFNADPYAATRRAVVRAAAAMAGEKT